MSSQYLELRFNRLVRLFSSLLYLAKTLFYMAIVVFGPSLALSQGIDGFITWFLSKVLLNERLEPINSDWNSRLSIRDYRLHHMHLLHGHCKCGLSDHL